MTQASSSAVLQELHRGHLAQEISLIILGSLLFSVSMNWIVLPHIIYSGTSWTSPSYCVYC